MVTLLALPVVGRPKPCGPCGGLLFAPIGVTEFCDANPLFDDWKLLGRFGGGG